ncbi:hypothetical protein GLYMA_02G231500v4 [Glycine max]|uniref:Uncharacterized protein n=2 Tax=Glycine subgen. Soja TaxID=1462606 RepID=I1JHH7_SOYBN|nr:hypothetical protein JHK87_004996 [Glycine soja]KAG5064150.1 hypothetical protein JHK85_005333 [Glycine max]KAG5081098.1 hypothetical protein JHK86_005163 [Glycine max]KAH1061706.1 hypothetical protein GYH30_004946 [Glycine max]KRH72752.1 hypothetical protein GLYMA_02G231500v4 [Glycine max]
MLCLDVRIRQSSNFLFHNFYLSFSEILYLVNCLFPIRHMILSGYAWLGFNFRVCF